MPSTPSKPSEQLFALVDGNNFYVSCERAFDPRLEGRPVIVLSNNDGCVVSRSAEAKQIGIAMAVPVYQVKDVIARHNVAVLSSNYSLYGDMSRRMMEVVGRFGPRQEIYSIDETFLDLGGMGGRDLAAHGRKIREEVGRCLGLPVCVGIAPTKTLAKLANNCAKKRKDYEGVCDWSRLDRRQMDELLRSFQVREIWGIGRRWAEKLQAARIKTAYDLAHASPTLLRDRYGIVLERTARELRGIACHGMEEFSGETKQIITSRSFGQPTESLDDLEEAVTQYTCRAAEKLRRQSGRCDAIQVYLETNHHRQDLPQYHPAVTVRLGAATDDSIRLTGAALKGLRHIYREGYRYIKAGVMLCGLQSDRFQQASLFDAPLGVASAAAGSRSRLMEVMDQVNRQAGRGTLRLASAGIKNSWTMKSGHISPGYTSNWDELPIALA